MAMMRAESDSVCFFLEGKDRRFFCCFFPEDPGVHVMCSSPDRSLGSDTDWLRAARKKFRIALL